MTHKQVLIISPYFPPVNAADMHRIRTSLPYFKVNGWEPTVVCIHEKYADFPKDELLMQALPPEVTVIKIKIIRKRWVNKLGIGSIALRSLWYYKKVVDRLLSSQKFDLIYFSTTQFPVCVLGAYWKRKWGIPYVIDMQDPWYSEYYRDKPRSQRPPKYWFAYRLNQLLEPIAMKQAAGLISVSQDYIDVLKSRYWQINHIPAATITFGAFWPDLPIAAHQAFRFNNLLPENKINIVYIGRGGADMHKAIKPVLLALRIGLTSNYELFNRLRVHFIGTSYAPSGKGRATIMPLAADLGINESVIEITDRIGYYHTLATLQQAQALLIPGSDDPQYTASKLFPYLLVKKPLMAVLHQKSSAVEVLTCCTKNAHVFTLAETENVLTQNISQVLQQWASEDFRPVTLLPEFEKYSAAYHTAKQTTLFDEVLAYAYKGVHNI